MDIMRRLKSTRLWFWTLLATSLLLLLGLIWYQPDYYKARASHDERPVTLGLNVARIPGSSPPEVAISVSQTIYPATFKDNKPGAVILVPENDWRTALLATELIHFPINAPILYTAQNEIPDLTWKEIKRLDPEGIFQDRNIKVLLIGDIGPGVKKQLQMEKLRYRHLKAHSPEELAALLDDYKAMFHVDHDDQVLIVPSDDPAYAMQAASWVAHMGHTILFASRQELPAATRRALDRRPQDAFIYVLADDIAIPASITEEMTRYGHVQRIPGSDPFDMSAGFAGYKDVGPNLGWWLERDTRSFGWGISEAGHNFTFVNPDHPQMSIPAAILSHKGKHGPFLLVNKEEIPLPVRQFLTLVQPTFTSSQEPLFNHGWVIGDPNIIGDKALQDLDGLLQVKR